MPPHANRRVTVSGPTLRFRDRTYEARTCRDEILDAVASIVGRTGAREFTTGEVVAEMTASSTAYARSTIAKRMRRISGRGERSYEYLELEPVGLVLSNSARPDSEPVSDPDFAANPA